MLTLLLPILLLNGSHPAPAPAVEAAETLITAESLMASVEFLCADALAGRLPGTVGYERAAAWGAARLAAAGLEPGGEDGFFQHLPIEVNEIEAATLALSGPDGRIRELGLGEDFACRGFSGQGDVDAQVVFVGYGLSLPERGYDDYADLDVRGKLVLAFKQEPAWRPADGDGWRGAHMPRAKAAAARAHGAVGLLLVTRPLDEQPQPPIASMMHGEGDHVADLPAVQISLAAAASLLAGGVEELKGLQQCIDAQRRPASTPLSARAWLTVVASYRPAADAVNVVGVLPGGDPALGGQCLVVGGHLDHVGQQGDVLWPGANDNASGAAAVLELAEAFARCGEAPARTIVFVLFAGEEQGLCGARRYVENPTRPLAETVAMFNLDCIAHGDSISLGGGRSQPRLWELAWAQDRDHAALAVAGTWSGGGADAQPFWEAGVPTLYFASKFSYTYLHQTGDTPATLNPGLYAEVVRLAYRAAREVAMGRYEREPLLRAD